MSASPQVAELDQGEFRFRRTASGGRPGIRRRGAADGIGARLFAGGSMYWPGRSNRGEDEIEVLESLLANQKFHEQVALAGRPVKLGLDVVGIRPPGGSDHGTNGVARRVRTSPASRVQTS